jgi:hypothetical protein
VTRLRAAVLDLGSTVDVRSLLDLTRSPREAAPC